MKVIKPTPITGAMVTSTNLVENVGVWNLLTNYAAGAEVLRSSTNRIYRRVASGTSAVPPESDSQNWVDVRPSNLWAMFDSEISSQSVAPGDLSVTFNPGYINSIGLFGLSGSLVHLTVTQGLTGPVVYQTTRLLEVAIITNYYEYFFEPIDPLESLILTDLPPYQDAQVNLTVEGLAGTAKCGVCVVGTFYELGQTQYGASSGIIDYSRKDTDAFGVTTFVKRPYSDRINVSLVVKKDALYKVKRLLSSLRATPCVWVGVGLSEFEVLDVFGFYRDFTLTIAYPSESLCTLEIEGLT